MTFIRNAWYASAWGHGLQADNMVSRKILGETLLFYRTSQGSATVMRDRCSHRFAPLSIGRREGDCVRCMYHGLVFDAAGKCVEEPGRKGVSPGALAGIPGISLPFGLADGLPFGLEIDGPQGSDLRMIAIARTVQEAIQGKQGADL